MSVYPPPTSNVDIFNPDYYGTDTSQESAYLTLSEANAIYAKLEGNQSILGYENFSSGIRTENITAITANNNINIGESLNLSSSKDIKINNVSVLSATSLGSGIISSSLQSLGNQNANLNLNTGFSYKINNTDVLTATTLGSTVLQSSLTTIGKLQAGCNISSGQSYKIENSAVLSQTTLGSTVTGSSLTSLGTLTAGLNIASSQTYKINSIAVLSADTLGSSVLNSSVSSIGTSSTTTISYLRTTSSVQSTQTTSATNVIINLVTGSSRYIHYESYSITLPVFTSTFILPFSRSTGFVKYIIRNSTYSYYLTGDSTLLGTTINPVGTNLKSSTFSTITQGISVIGSSTPSISIPFTTTLASSLTLSVVMYYQTE